MNAITASDSIRYAEAGADPAFDGDMEELERPFAELRLTLNHTDQKGIKPCTTPC
ncbi:MAG TPA: hypothetical protein VMS17_05245 [Gemmataceae bacterium]|nr:hypothetical protein [Gemmataceae bacterium]